MYIAMIPKADGDAAILGQRPRIWASARMVQLEDWFRSWVPGLGFQWWWCRGSVEAWNIAALDIEEVISLLLRSLNPLTLTLLTAVSWTGF